MDCGQLGLRHKANLIPGIGPLRWLFGYDRNTLKFSDARSQKLPILLALHHVFLLLVLKFHEVVFTFVKAILLSLGKVNRTSFIHKSLLTLLIDSKAYLGSDWRSICTGNSLLKWLASLIHGICEGEHSRMIESISCSTSCSLFTLMAVCRKIRHRLLIWVKWLVMCYTGHNIDSSLFIKHLF